RVTAWHACRAIASPGACPMSNYSAAASAPSGPSHGRPALPPRTESAPRRPSSSVLDLLGPDDPLRREMERLLADGRSSSSQPTATTSPPYPASPPPPAAALPEDDESSQLREENARLRARVEELEQMLEATTEQTDQMWTEQQKEYEALLE